MSCKTLGKTKVFAGLTQFSIRHLKVQLFSALPPPCTEASWGYHNQLILLDQFQASMAPKPSRGLQSSLANIIGLVSSFNGSKTYQETVMLRCGVLNSVRPKSLQKLFKTYQGAETSAWLRNLLSSSDRSGNILAPWIYLPNRQKFGKYNIDTVSLPTGELAAYRQHVASLHCTTMVSALERKKNRRHNILNQLTMDY